MNLKFDLFPRLLANATINRIDLYVKIEKLGIFLNSFCPIG